MISLGLDIGTGFVKCVSDTMRIRFPSLYAYKVNPTWAGDTKVVQGVGDDAVRIARDPDAIVLRPVMLGRPVHEDAFARLVSHAVNLSCEKKDATSELHDGISLVAGLPYDAARYRDPLKRMIAKRFAPVSCDIFPQVIGTLADAGLQSAIIVSIGQGTTEIVVFENNMPIRGRSVHHAVEFISSRLGGDLAYIDDTIYSSAKTARLVNILADLIANNVERTRQDLEGLPVLVSGGGILVPGMQSALESKLGKITVHKDPVMSNALGLYRIARLSASQSPQ